MKMKMKMKMFGLKNIEVQSKGKGREGKEEGERSRNVDDYLIDTPPPRAWKRRKEASKPH